MGLYYETKVGVLRNGVLRFQPQSSCRLWGCGLDFSFAVRYVYAVEGSRNALCVKTVGREGKAQW